MKKIFVLTALSMLLFACGSSFGAATETPTAEPTATEDLAATEAAVVEATEAALEVKASEEAMATVEAMSQKTATAEVKQTEKAASRMTSTAEAVLQMTAVADPAYNEVAYLYDNGYINSMDGVYFPLDDFRESWAQMNYFDIWPTGYAPSNFVLSTDIEWESASDKANWFNSGCGFVFRLDPAVGGYYIVFLTLDGNVGLSRWQNGSSVYRDQRYYGKLEVPNGEARLTITADGDNINIFVNGKHVLRRNDSAFADGYLGYSLVSGTNKDFGTRCTMTNGSLWDLDAVNEPGEKTGFTW